MKKYDIILIKYVKEEEEINLVTLFQRAIPQQTGLAHGGQGQRLPTASSVG